MNAKRNPVAGEDYPETWSEFLDWFHSEDACLRYFERLRWRPAFICPRCGVASEPYRATRGRLVCSACQHQSTVTAGTIFDKTRTPLRVWFAAAWYITSQKHGVSALGMKCVLGLGSYQTAWAMLHRFRRAMVRPDRDKLSGIVEVDESYIAITDRLDPPSRAGKKSRTTKTLVAIAVEVKEPKGFGRVRIRRIDAGSKEVLLPFVCDEIEPGAIVRTDGSFAYLPLVERGYEHERSVIAGSGVPAHVPLPGVHRIASLLKRWLLGTHHGAVQPAHLDDYLAEFAFRFNRRSSRSRGLLFYRLLEQAVAGEPVTYSAITNTGSGG